MKKVVSLLLVLAIVFSLMAGMGISSYAATQVELIINRAAYLAANNPHAYDGQCLSFCADCYKAAGYTGVSMGTAYNAGTAWIQSTSSSNIPVGALVFFDLTWHATAGHVGIYAGNGKMYDAESQYGGIKLRNFTTKGYRGWGWYNRIAPTGSSTVDITTPTLSFNKGSYSVGETATITWTASPSNSNFKHYWLVITNTTSGKQYYGTATGGDGDVSKNYYNLTLSEAGTYKVDVYAVRHDGSGKSDSKSFSVGKYDLTTPTISFNKSSYVIGETAKITWAASSSQSDFKHYWLVIKNTTSGKQYYGTATGGDGDVSKNYYNLTLTEPGTYKVDVYAVNHAGGGKSDSKSFSVGQVELTTPTISFNKSSYVVGETAKITWAASSSQSDFKHYWLVIKNTTSGKQYYGTATGGDGDVSKNYYDLALTEAGTFKVDVYAVDHGGGGKSDSKTFTVTQACTNHSYSSKITKSATCTATGVKTFTCSKCGDSYTQTIAALGHDYKASVTKAATCTEKGVKIFKCSCCTSSYTQEIAALGHNYISIVTHRGYFEIYNDSWTSHNPYTLSNTCTRCNYWKTTWKDIPIKSVTLQKKTFVYTGSAITPTVTVKNNDGKTLKKGVDYTVKYESGRKKVGTYFVKVYFNNEYYEGTATILFNIVPKGTSLSKVTAGKKSFTANWKQNKSVTGYVLQYSTDKNFKKGVKTVTIKSNKTLKTTVKKLSAKKTYSVRIRTYKTIYKVKYYSSWSGAKKVTTKK